MGKSIGEVKIRSMGETQEAACLIGFGVVECRQTIR